MSKNITIKEGATAKQLTVDKLKINLVSGGTCLWVPEDETELTTKTITENGTYKASDDGYYGYSEVTVSGIGTATGTGEDGETHQYTEDGEGGITDTILPDSIVVESPPTVTEYYDTAIIDFSGIVVKAYLKSGNLWTDDDHPDGIIPIEELTFPVTAADYDETTGQTASSELVPVDFECASNGGYTTEYSNGDWFSTTTETANNDGLFTLKGSIGGKTIKGIAASKSPDTVITENWVRDNGQTSTDTRVLRLSYTYNMQTVYYGTWSSAWNYSPNAISEIAPNGSNVFNTYDDAAIAWSMMYGTITPGGQVIPVQYVLSSGKTLESSFNITVYPHPMSGAED